MPHQNTVLHGLLQHIPWDCFDRLVRAHGVDDAARGFSAKRHLVAMLYAQFSGGSALREVQGGLGSHAGQLYHLGAAGRVPRSTLADANRGRPAAVFAALFETMLAGLTRGQRKQMAGATYLVDASVLPLSGRGTAWARFSDDAVAAKLHLIYDATAERPIHAAITAARVNDITAAKQMPIQPGATYVFDLGYYDYGWWARLSEAGCTIVTRLKRNTVVQPSETRPLAPASPVLSDQVGTLPKRQASNRRNPMDKPVREVRVRSHTGTLLRLLTNDLKAPAEQIAALYRRRWEIELFFRWIKQTLRIRKFLGRSENAVRIQVITALIAHLLLHFARAVHAPKHSLLDFARLVRATLMHRRQLNHLERPPKPQPRHPETQLALL